MTVLTVWMKKLRPLPITIGLMSVLLSAKVMTLLHEVGGAPAALGSAGRAMVPTAQAASPPHGAPAGGSHGGDGGRAASPPPAPAPAAAQTPAIPVPDPIPDSERAVLLDLRARRSVIEAREQALAAREAVLGAAEKRLSDRVDQLTALQARLEQLEAGRREHDEANWRGLVKTYEAMRPRDAATILNDLDMPILLQVLDRMKEAKAALVLAAMLPDRARSATQQLAQMRSRSITPQQAVQPAAVAPGSATPGGGGRG